MEYSRIEEVNNRLCPMELERTTKNGKVIKNKYNTVNQRILAFRELYPNGSLQTEILSIADGVVLFKATAFDDEGKVIATGHAQEKEDSSFINKTSYIENCETSAIGRALGIIGIGAVDSLASFEEVANAIKQQEADKGIENITNDLKELYSKAGGKNFEKWVSDCGGISLEKYPEMKTRLLKQISEMAEKEKK